MAITNVSDVKVYNEEMQAGYIETAQQFTNAFNGASNGAITMVGATKLGNYEKEAFFTELAASTLITRQDITSNSSVTPQKLGTGENVRVKVHRKIGPVDSTFKAFNMIGEDAQREFSFLLGQSIAKAQPVVNLNAGLLAARAAIGANTAMVNDVTGTSGTCTHANLIGAMRKMGDARDRLRAWVMHSTQFYDLALDAVAQSVDSVVAGILQVFTIPSIGIPVVVTDSDSLIVTADTPDSYYVLGLTADALQLIDSETTNIVTDVTTGNEQLELRVQGEYAINIGVKGFQWDVANGGANPTDTALGTGTNWDQIATDDKNTAGVALKCIAA
ncbi:MAG: hypothetical protein E6Q97_30980 [Desulfurellales bacterium]|nr:MAG: hypothetical protein E6Q97_30980 [Desulfurellales bacterium]